MVSAFMLTQIPAGSIAANLEGVRARLRKAALAANRGEQDVSLIAVSKTHGIEAVNEAIAAGQTIFGENRVQEAAAKFPSIKAANPSVEVHLIGPLQTNKVRDAVALFDAIHTLDRESLAEALAREFRKSQRKPWLLVQVNTGEEPQKAGIAPQDTAAFLERCHNHWNLKIDGLMCIPPVEEEPAMHFALLLKLAREAGLSELSMGMSGDFEAAIAFGATCVRVGSAIFGERSQVVSDPTQE